MQQVDCPAWSMQDHLDFFLARYLELLDDIHSNMWSEEDGASWRTEIIERIKDLGPEYVNFYLPVDLEDPERIR